MPARSTRNCSRRADEQTSRCIAAGRQIMRVTVLPLSAVLVCSASAPLTLNASSGTIRLTVPLVARCWQSRHQQMQVAMGSAVSLKLTLPHRQRPVRSVISVSSGSACN